ncbi:MAG TPA: LysM domain-containing protein [Solirubrobacterales bacterium]|nr:LysM domain-containing protein [Solirubrobacterales bacterium]
MKKRNSVTARILAALALIAVIFAVVSIVSSGLKDDSSKSKKSGSNHPAKQHQVKHRTKAKTYEVQTGDTLTSIAHKTGISVHEILVLNPEVDPQILIAGEVLKLQE